MRLLVALALLVDTAHGFACIPPATHIVTRRALAIRMDEVGDDAMSSSPSEDGPDLQAALKQAVSSKMGRNLGDIADAMKPDDSRANREACQSLADAIAERKQRLAARKLEVGEEAALAELDAEMRGKL